MASIYALKPAFQNSLRPLVERLARHKITANQVTLAALFLSLAGGGAIALFPGHAWPLLLLPAILLARMALNAIDGMLAREHAMQSPLGAVLNELGDVISDAALYLPLALVTGISAPLMVMLVVLAILTETAGILGPQIGASRRYDGPMGKSDRAFTLGALALTLGLGAPPGLWVDGLLVAVCVLLVLTVFNRSAHAIRESAL